MGCGQNAKDAPSGIAVSSTKPHKKNWLKSHKNPPIRANITNIFPKSLSIPSTPHPIRYLTTTVQQPHHHPTHIIPSIKPHVIRSSIKHKPILLNNHLHEENLRKAFRKVPTATPSTLGPTRPIGIGWKLEASSSAARSSWNAQSLRRTFDSRDLLEHVELASYSEDDVHGGLRPFRSDSIFSFA